MSDDVQVAPPADSTTESVSDFAPGAVAEVVSQETTIAALVGEYSALAAPYPVPDLRVVFADVRWADEIRSTAGFNLYRGMYIAIADKQVRGSGDTDIACRVAAAKIHHLHPERFYVTYIDGPGDLFNGLSERVHCDTPDF